MAFNSSVITTAISNYIDQLTYNKFEIEILLQGRTSALVAKAGNLIQGIKLTQTINTLPTVLQIVPDGCDLFNPTGSNTLNQVALTVSPLKTEQSICYNGANTLEQIWVGMKLPKGSYYDSGKITPENFAEAFVGALTNKLQDANEFLIWQGSTTGATFSGSGAYPTFNNYAGFQNQANGYLNNLLNTSASQSISYYTGANRGALPVGGTAAFFVVDQFVQDQMTYLQNLSDRDDLTLFMSYPNYRSYMSALRALNLYPYYGIADESAETVKWTFNHPGTNVKLVATSGLVGSNYMLLTYIGNMYVGCDASGEENNMQVWYEPLYNSTLVRPQWKIGTAIAFPQYCYIYDPNGGVKIS